jgi:CheY-like chemotaxis protein
LVVDDESDARELTQRILEEFGAEVTAAGGAAEAIEAYAAHHPAALVSDIGMPEMDGYDLVRALPNVPAVALTAYGRPEDRARALAAGFKHFVTKPVTAAELVSAVANLKAARRA